MKRIVIPILLVLGLLGLGLWWFVWRDAGPATAEQRAPEPADSPAPASTAAERATAPAAPEPAAARPPPRTAEIVPARAASRQRELLDQIHRAGEGSAPMPPSRALPDPSGRAVLGREEIMTAVKAVTPLMQECYEKRLQENEELQGKAVVKFTVHAKDGQGRLDDGEVKSSTLDDLRLETCMLHALTRARFPLPQGKGKITVTYPFRFRPKSPPRE